MSLKHNFTDEVSTKLISAAGALERIESAKMTRRAALTKVGIRAGVAVFAALNVDTIARMVGVELERQGKNNRVADKLAREFKNAGVAFASGSGNPCWSDPDCLGCCQHAGTICQLNCGFEGNPPPPGCIENCQAAETACEVCG